MLMSHLEADTLDELHEFAEKLGLRKSWFQDKSIPHYDVSKSVRSKAIELGAVAEDCFSENNKDRIIRHMRQYRKDK